MIIKNNLKKHKKKQNMSQLNFQIMIPFIFLFIHSFAPNAKVKEGKLIHLEEIC